MVRVHVKHDDGEFLYDSETTSPIDEIAEDITEIANLQSKIQYIAVEFEHHLSKLQGDPKVMPLVLSSLSEATSYASKLLEENTVQLLWAGKELTRGKKLCDFIGRNEKTKIIIKLQPPVPPPASLSGGENS